MQKAELARRIAEELGCTTTKAEAAVEALLSTMKAALQQGEPIILRHFGTFAVRAKRARMGRNPKTGAAAAIPARRVVRFKAGKPLKQVVTGPMPTSDAGDSTAQHLPTRTEAGRAAGAPATTDCKLSVVPARPRPIPASKPSSACGPPNDRRSHAQGLWDNHGLAAAARAGTGGKPGARA